MSTRTPSQPAAPPPAAAAPHATNRVVADLVGAGLVPAGRAEEARKVVSRALGEGPPGAGPGAGSRLAEIAGYVGGALVVAAVGLVVATGWTELSDTGQVVALALVTVVLAAAGLVAGRVGGGYAELRTGRDETRRRLTSALLVAAAVGAGFTVARLVELARDEFDSWPSLAGGLVVLALGAASYRIAPSALAQLAMLGAAVTAVTSALSLVGSDSGSVVVLAFAFLALGVGWVGLAEARVLREQVFGRFAGVALALVGAQLPLFEVAWLGYLLTLVLAGAGFVLYLRTVSWPYLVAGVLGITLVVPEAVVDWTDGSLGIAGGVLVAGLTLLAASLAGLRVRREASD